VLDTETRELIRMFACGGPGPFDVARDLSAGRTYITGCTDLAVAVIDLDTLNVTEMLRPTDAIPDVNESLGWFVEGDPSTGSVYLIVMEL
jgi:hypothetical protein